MLSVLKCSFGISYGIGQKYLPIWVSVLVSDQNQNSGFGRTLQIMPPDYYLLDPSDFQTFLQPCSGCVILQFCRKFPFSSFTRLPCKIKLAEPSTQEFDDTHQTCRNFPVQTGFDSLEKWEIFKKYKTP